MSASPFSILAQIFYEPSKAFEAMKDKPNVWLPLLLIPLATAAMMWWYFSTVDAAWYIDQMMSRMPPDMKPDQRAMVASSMSINTMKYGTLGGLLIGTPIALAIYALYLTLAGKMIGSTVTYGKWFAFSAWVSVPSLLGLPLMALQIATGHGQIIDTDLNMLSLNFIIFHLPTSAAWAGFVGSISLPTFWTIFLSFTGLRVWTGKSAGTCAVVSLLPYAVIYGCWALKIILLK